MPGMTVDREELIAAIGSAVVTLPGVLAMWEAGSRAFDRADAWSDLDLYVLVEDDAVESVVAAIDEALDAAAGIRVRHRIPEPTSHGHAQLFYSLQAASPYLVVDLVVLRRSVPEWFLEQERNGEPDVVFDRTGLVSATELDRDRFAAATAERRRVLVERFEIFQPFVSKEVHRGNALGAIAAYHAITLRPLIDVLGMLHVPERYDFGAHYAHLDYPPDVVARLERLSYPTSIEEVEVLRAEAEAWFREVVAALGDA
jgi:hypothetical protein